ncbi:MAG: hypothetical protein JOZ61_10705 [Verrucomicrobia bacterium]|nr:hypothetical protein [Hyphomicrobiales bacterium]MBV8330920.1 hypothetical protein [Verrucomicrobiota bacterium]
MFDGGDGDGTCRADTEVEKRIRRFFTTMEARLAAALARARAEGELADGVEPSSAARVRSCLLEGLRVLGKTGIDRTEWQTQSTHDSTVSQSR